MPARLLAASDIHLGRRPTRLPDDLSARGIDAESLTPVAAWTALVDHACEQRVDALLLAGDVIESLADRFRALWLVERGVRRLADAGIPVLAVAGNHDVHALPRLADAISGVRLAGDEPAFALLGRGGAWETATIRGRDGTRVRVAGWSFAAEHERRNPLDAFALPARSGLATVGLLHCDVDGGSSPYAPVPHAQLVDAETDAWLLGHVHAPGELRGPRPVGYLGSLVGLDPGEPGERGAWLLTVEGPGAVGVERVPLAPLRWESLGVPVDSVEGEDEQAIENSLGAAVRDALSGLHARIAPRLGAARLVGCRVRLVGRSPRRRAIAKAVQAARIADVALDADDTHYFIESIVDRSEPSIDLEALARSDDPPGLLARRLLALRGGGGDHLIESACRSFEELAATAHWSPAGSAVTPGEARDLLISAGLAALDELLASTGPEPER